MNKLFEMRAKEILRLCLKDYSKMCQFKLMTKRYVDRIKSIQKKFQQYHANSSAREEIINKMFKDKGYA